MAYTHFTVNAGHSLISRGASSGIYKEEVIARQFKDKLIKAFKEVGAKTTDTTSEAKTSSAVLVEQVKKANAVNKNGRLDLSIHLNSNAGNPATGSEVLYYSEEKLAAQLSSVISKTLGMKDRGAKKRTDLYFLKQTNAPAVLLELCFVNNESDVKKLLANMDKLAEDIVFSLTGKRPKKETKTESPKKLFRVQVGAFSVKSNAENLAKELKTKGYPAIIIEN